MSKLEAAVQWGTGPPEAPAITNLLCEWSYRGRGTRIAGIPLSGWAPSPRSFRMWEMEDERSCISRLSDYSV